MSKQVWKGSALVAPVPPALVSCGTLEAPNVLTVAWTGMLQSQPPKTYISVRPERYSHGLITESREFVINLPTAALVRAPSTIAASEAGGTKANSKPCTLLRLPLRRFPARWWAKAP